MVVFLYIFVFPYTDKSYGMVELPTTKLEPIVCVAESVSNIFNMILLMSNAFDIFMA